MRLLRSVTLASVIALPGDPGSSVAQDNYAQDQDYYAQDQDYYPASYANTQLFSAEELDNLVAPIALYPDPILAQVFIAATFADQVDIAARHVRLFGTSGIDNQPWDLSVKAVAYYPPVLNMLAERTDWSAALGQAYAVQPQETMDAVQRLRYMARQHGNLVTNEHQTVIVEREVVRIVPAHPRVIYVPVYEPAVVYYRPVFFQAQFHSAYFSFGIGFPIGSWLSYDCDWNRRRVYYDGWRGHGWRARSRPFINIVNVYVNPRYEVVNINRTIIHRTVNYINLARENKVHRGVKFDTYARNITRIATVERESARGRALPRIANSGSSQVSSGRAGGSQGAAAPRSTTQPRADVARQQQALGRGQQAMGRGQAQARPQSAATQSPQVQSRVQAQSSPQVQTRPQAQARPQVQSRAQVPQRKETQARSQQTAPARPQVQSRPQTVTTQRPQVQSRPQTVTTQRSQVQSRPQTVTTQRPQVQSRPQQSAPARAQQQARVLPRVSGPSAASRPAPTQRQPQAQSAPRAQVSRPQQGAVQQSSSRASVPASKPAAAQKASPNAAQKAAVPSRGKSNSKKG